MKKKLERFLDNVITLSGAVSDAAYRAKSVHVWHSADGRVTPIPEMDDQWLVNAIRCVERNTRGQYGGTPHARALPFLRAELASRQAKPVCHGAVTTRNEWAHGFGRPFVARRDRTPSRETRPHMNGSTGQAKKLRELDGRVKSIEQAPAASASDVNSRIAGLLHRVQGLERNDVRRIMSRVLRRVRFDMSVASCFRHFAERLDSAVSQDEKANP